MKKAKKRKLAPRRIKKSGLRKSIFFATAFIVFLLLFLIHTLNSHANTTITVTALEDSFTSQSNPTKNYGSDIALKVDSDKSSYLKFDLTQLAGQPITQAKLRMYITNDSSTMQYIKETASTPWTEATISYNNQPVRGPRTFAQMQNSTINTWFEADVTQFVKDYSGQVATLVIEAAPGSNNNLNISSRNSSFAPQLAILTDLIEVATPTPTPVLEQPTPTQGPAATSAPTATPTLNPPPSSGRAVNVSTAAQLTTALADAQPGDIITIADGLYKAKLKSPIPIGSTYYTASFVMTKSGTAESPIVIQGTRDARIDGGGLGGHYGLYLITANYVHLKGFTVENGDKGLIVDRGNHNVIDGVEIKDIHDEGLHLRALSADNIVKNSYIHHIGRNKATGIIDNHYGEGIYIGSANSSNWCTYSGCQPDACDRNQIINNTITNTGGESIDVKEGTSNGLIANNTFDTPGIAGSNADSWIDIKGNNWTISGNHGINSLIGPGYEVHGVLTGWGKNNTFLNNTADNVATYGFWIQNNVWGSANGNVVSCNNVVTTAPSGFANVACTN